MSSTNQSQLHSTPIFKKDDAFQTLILINTWIENIDTKVSFALTLQGVLIGVLFSKGLPNAFQKLIKISTVTKLSCLDIISLILISLLYFVSFSAIVCFIQAIIARIKVPTNMSSMFFFGSIGKMELQSYKLKMSQITEIDLIEDLEEQIHTNSKICTRKANWYNIGIRFLMATIFLEFICMIFKLL